MGHLEESHLLSHGAREGSPLVAEKLALQQLPGEPCAVHVEKGLFGPRAVGVKPRREHAFSRARLSSYQNRRVRVEHSARLLGQPADRGAAAAKRIGLPPRLPGLIAEPPAAVSLILENPLEDQKQRRQLQRFRQELLGSLLNRDRRRLERLIGREHDARDQRIGALDPRDQLERVAVRERPVQDHRVRRASPKSSRAARRESASMTS